MQNILVIGATSAIAKSTARLWAQRGDNLYLLARNQEHLLKLAEDLKIRGAPEVHSHMVDVDDFATHLSAIEMVFKEMGEIDAVLIAHGTLPDQHECERDVDAAMAALRTNALSTISLLTHLANKLEVQGSGTIAVITSVAADRGRQSNYVYGSAKGMLSVFLQGLRNRLYRAGVDVLEIKPGFVDTPMTSEFKKGLLWVKPETVASKIVWGIDRKKYQIYSPGFWYFIMLGIRLIPETIFRRGKL